MDEFEIVEKGFADVGKLLRNPIVLEVSRARVHNLVSRRTGTGLEE